MAEEVYMQVVAIIDSETTQICLHAAGQIQSVSDDVQNVFPPFDDGSTQDIDSLLAGSLKEDDALAEARAKSDDLWNSMSEAEQQYAKRAMDVYTGPFYEQINQTLQGTFDQIKRDKYDMALSPEKASDYTKYLQGLFKRVAPLDHDIRVKRTMGFYDKLGNAVFPTGDMAGLVLDNPGFSSTTSAARFASIWNRKVSGPLDFEFVIPKGTRVIHPATFDLRDDVGNEILVAPGAKMRIMDDYNDMYPDGRTPESEPWLGRKLRGILGG